ncbi:MAG: diguanylate cyclase [Syntrophobacteraceae bacterium]
MNSEQRSSIPIQTILVVDDEPGMCEIISDALSGQGHKVESAADGVEAVEKVKKSKFTMVVTDMEMPRMDGMQLIEYIVSNHADIDIIAITGHGMKYRYTEVVDAGAADFITKPFTLNELEAKLNRLIRERCLRQQLAKLAVRDPLTALLNRRSFEENVRKEAIRITRYRHSLFLFFMDVDNFKKYNDLYGHQAGDLLLVEIGKLLTDSIRENIDSVYRYGGDEFIMLLLHMPAEQVLGVAKRIRRKFDLLKFEPTSISIGVAKFIARSGTVEQDIQDMIQRADFSLYTAKKGLGNKGVFVDEGSR